jgi:endo-1,4-beta-xylanase
MDQEDFMKKIMALLAVIASTLFISACGQSELDGEKAYRIIAKSAPRYIETRDGSAENGARIQINDNMKTDIQKWIFIKDENGFYQIISKVSGRCLQVSGDIIHLADNTKANEQKWILLQDRQGFYLIVSRITGQAFDLTGAGVAAGTPIGAFWAHAADSQKWSIIAAE